jgi:transposase InsO family protein
LLSLSQGSVYYLPARPRRRGLPKDVVERAALSDNILDRAFEASAPNQKWIADFTYIWTAEGWLYVVAVVDLFSRRVVGWEMKAQLATDALIMASGGEVNPTLCSITAIRAANIRANSSSA